jgi:ERCC4-type nuclease
VEKSHLEFGDFAFEGRGPLGTVMVGIERKTLHDMLSCIEDARYAGHQRPGMKSMYDVSVLVVEGLARPHDPDGFLMEGFNGGVTWGYCKHRSTRAMYSKLARYLISVRLSGVYVEQARDPFHTAYTVHEWYQYFQRAWESHTSMLEMQKIVLPSLTGKPSLTRRWAKELDGIGVKGSEGAARMFKTPIALAEADELEWLRVPGIGVKTAQSIYREIHGMRK